MVSSSSPPPKRRRSNRNKDDSEDTASPAVATSTPDKSSPVVVFAHGAGAPSSSDWMIRWKDKLGKVLNAVEVVTFDYPYISGRKRGVPPKADKLVEFHSDVVKKTVAKYPGHPLVLAGKSMGSRVSCMVANEEEIAASAVVCLGYPLKGVKGTVRDETLLQLAAPIMFIQGSKDVLCPLDKLEDVRKKMKSLTALHVIDGGDHSFKIGKKHLISAGLAQDEAEDLAVTALAEFAYKALGGRLDPLLTLNLPSFICMDDQHVLKQSETIGTRSSNSQDVSSSEWEFINMTEQEEDLINRMYRLVGDRWDLIAGRLIGRRAEEIERFWIMKHCKVFAGNRNQFMFMDDN